MAYEVEFLHVDSGEKSGDAITVRWQEGDNPQNLKIGVIDGGTKASGEALVKHIKDYYGQSVEIEFVLNTHPDSDHCSGLTLILENFKVKTLWMHRPWLYSKDILNLVEDDRVTDVSIKRRLKEKLSMAHDLEKLAVKKGVQIKEPFQGEKVGFFTVLSPRADWYKTLIADFRDMPALKEDTSFLSKAAEIVKGLFEDFDVETLKDAVSTSSENESSVVLYGEIFGRKVLLTGDVGVLGLNEACTYAERVFPNWRGKFNLVQIPHHGSRHNVNPATLDRLLGPKTTESRGTAICSASKGSTKHPKKSVLNAFTRRGYGCFRTNGNTVRHNYNFSDRGWTTLTAIPLSNEVEGYD